MAINYIGFPNMRTELTYDGLGRRVKIVEKDLPPPAISWTLKSASQFTAETSSTVSLAAGTYTLTITGLNPNGGTNTAWSTG